MPGSPPASNPPNHPSNVLLPMHHAVSVQLTWHCNIACRFCALRCSPRSDETMELDLFEKLLEEFVQARERIQHIEIAGGEVFTRMGLLQSVAERFHERKMPWIPITNAFWATSRERAREVLSRLPGIMQIVFSVDKHHQALLFQTATI